MKKLKFLITGGMGFIGSALVRHIINNTEHDLINLDNLSYAANLKSVASVVDSIRYKFEQIDICDTQNINRILQQYQPDIIIHLAAESHVDRSINDSAPFIQTNIVGTYALLEAARKYFNNLEPDCKHRFRFLHVSTDEVYGDLFNHNEVEKTDIKFTNKTASINSSKDLLFTESSPYAPSSPYAATKASSDHLVRAWYRTYNLPAIITNCSNNYGPFQHSEKLIPLIINNALQGKQLPIYGAGSQIRDWLFVEDHVRALMLVATKGKIGETYNIGAHNEKTNLEVVHALCKILDSIYPVQENPNLNKKRTFPNDFHTINKSIEQNTTALNSYADLIMHVNDRPGHDVRYAIDASKINNELGWVAKESFTTGLLKTVEWYFKMQFTVNGSKHVF